MAAYPKKAYALCPGSSAKVQSILKDALLHHPSQLLRIVNVILDLTTNCDGSGSNPVPTINPNIPIPPQGDGSLAFFCQADPALQINIQPAIINLGCGPTSMSIINCTKTGWDNSSKMNCPTKAGNFAQQLQAKKCAWNGGYTSCYGSGYGTVFTNEQGMSLPAVVNVLQGAGRHVEIVIADIKEWKKKIDEGKLLLTYSPDTPCSQGCAEPRDRKLAHIFVVDAVDETAGTARLRDPIHCGYSTNYQEVSGGRWLKATVGKTTDLDSFQIKTAFAVQ